jgi:predicted amidohydrolase YtcJ
MGEMLLYNGTIHTVDEHKPSAEAVHILGGRIVYHRDDPERYDPKRYDP